ncbi:MAG: hypothetical protein HQL88_02010 [Magnetococcales bacterium]|nr:hypothetical protein [Magnetococcales bacterium]
MSLPVTHVTSHDGRLSERPAPSAVARERGAEADLSAAQEDFVGRFFSSPGMAEIRKKNRWLQNANDAVALIQVADDGLDGTVAVLHRMRQITFSPHPVASQAFVDLFLEQLELTEEIWLLTQRTTYARQPLLTGQIQKKPFVVGERAEQVIPISIADVCGMALALQTEIGEAVREGDRLGSQGVVECQRAQIERMLGDVTRIRTDLDALQSRFSAVIALLQQVTDVTEGAMDRVVRGDVAAEVARLTRRMVQQQGENSVAIQANQHPRLTQQLLQ